MNSHCFVVFKFAGVVSFPVGTDYLDNELDSAASSNGLPGDIGSKFFKSAMSDSRKVLMPPLFVAHDRALSALRDAALLELELIPTIHPTTRKPTSSGQGKLKLPSHAEWLTAELPQVERKLTEFAPWMQPPTPASPVPPDQPPDLCTQLMDFLQDCWQTDATPDEPPSTHSRLRFWSIN